MAKEESLQYISHGSNLALPYASHVACMGHIHLVGHPVAISLQKFLPQFVLIELFEGLLEVVLRAHKIRSLVRSQLADWATTTNKAAVGTDERVCCQGIGNF